MVLFPFLWTLTACTPGGTDMAGGAVSGAGDTDGDGLGDLPIGGSGYGTGGAAWLIGDTLAR
jgi:hypothetical protein